MDNAFQALKKFANAIQHQFSLPGSSSPEDQLKAPVVDIIKEIGGMFNLDISSTTEARISEHRVRPDIAIYEAGLICGYVELKKPGLGADAPKLKDKHNKEQWEKLKNLPNLIYCDGREWALYRHGERTHPSIRFQYDPSTAGDNAIDNESADQLVTMLRDFLTWAPHVPHRPREMADFLAPLTKFLRDEVELALKTERSNVGLLADEWRSFFFPDADDTQFADAYAQTVTYALLLARMQGEESLEPQNAARSLDKGNGVLALALDRLGQPEAKKELRVGFELLQRSLEALDPTEFQRAKPEMWLYFYEDFLAAYDPQLRRDYGVYYTPREVVELQVRLSSELLEQRFNKKLGFADDGVVFLDPAVGTGNYLVATVNHALKTVEERSGQGAVAGRATQMAENMYGFEILVGPYAVAHLRLSQVIEGVGGTLPSEGRVKLYLADTLESPNASPPGGLTLTYKVLTQEHEAARKIKQDGEIIVCLGNPPYDQQRIDVDDTTTVRKGGWVRFGDSIKGGAKQEEQGVSPIFNDFIAPAKEAGAGVHLKTLYNDCIYFWRWVLWRLFDQQECGGIVTFITASSYIAGPGFVGMRKVMRQTFDELWIIDLGGDNHGTRKTPNVFNIQTPVAIAVGVRGKSASNDAPAKTRYVNVSGDTRDLKLAQLNSISALSDIKWKMCSDDWHKPFLPEGEGDYFEWPRIADLFPWNHSGAQFGRSWPIGETEKVLSDRFDALKSASSLEKPTLLKESRDRKASYIARDEITGQILPTVLEMNSQHRCPRIYHYGFRSFDRQYALIDDRFGDYLRKQLMHTKGKGQLFFTTLLTEVLAKGPALVATVDLPDLNYFNGRGGRVVPLYRDLDSTQPNITKGLLEFLARMYDEMVTPEDLAAYVYAMLSNNSYTKRFWSELETPDPRVPITKDVALFRIATKLGRQLITLHTYEEIFQSEGQSAGIKPGTAKCIKAIPSDPEKYPDTFDYKLTSNLIMVGEGEFGPVMPEIWGFEVSGLKVVQSWLGYRMKIRAGKKSSPLDDIRPERWTPKMTDDFLQLLWVLEHTLSMEPDLSRVLEEVVNGSCFRSTDLPEPTEKERKPPRSADEKDNMLAMMEEESTIEDDI